MAAKAGDKAGANDRTVLGFPPAASGVPASVTSVAALQPGAIIADRYVLDAPVSEGGMATIWGATDRATGRSVIVKSIHLRLSDNAEAVKRFMQEADIIAALRSPHVVELLDRGVLAGAPFLVLERLEGEDLEERLGRRRLSVDECVTVLDQVALALMPAHRDGVVHRDLKPANIFLARGIDGEVVKLLDFGIAKLREGTLVHTAAGQTVGSPGYMSPEQIQGRCDLDGRSDLFAMATVLYTCLTGKEPFAGPTIAHSFERIMAGDVVPPSVEAPDVPRRIDAFFERAFACDRTARYPDAAAMAEAFRACAVDDAPEVEVVAGAGDVLAEDVASVPAPAPAAVDAPAPSPIAAELPPPRPHAIDPLPPPEAPPRRGAMARPLLVGSLVACAVVAAIAVAAWSADPAPPEAGDRAVRTRTEQVPAATSSVAPTAPEPRTRGR